MKEKKSRHRKEKKKKQIQFVMLDDADGSNNDNSHNNLSNYEESFASNDMSFANESMSNAMSNESLSNSMANMNIPANMMNIPGFTEEMASALAGPPPLGPPIVDGDSSKGMYGFVDDEDSRAIMSESILQMNREEFMESFDEYYDKWVAKLMQERDPMEQFKLAVEFFRGESDIPELPDRGYSIAVAKLNFYLLYIMQHEDSTTFDEEEIISYHKKIDQMIRLVYQYNQAYKVIVKNNEVVNQNYFEDQKKDKGQWILSPSIMEFIRPDNITPKYNEKQKLHIRLLKQLSIKGYRKYGEWCYEEIKTENGQQTHAWKQACKVEDFVIEFCNRLISPENWDVLTKGSKSGVADMVEKLTQLDDPEFPYLKKDRHKFSFKNGIFLTKVKTKDANGNTKYTCKFFPYDSEEIINVSNRLASTKFHNVDFHDHSQDDLDDWYDIPTPTFQKVLDHQYKYLPDQEYIDVCKWFYVFFGRCFFDVKELDGWQSMMYILGEPGTGKSTLFKDVLQKIYDEFEIGILDNNMERQFGLENLLGHDLYVLIGQELDENFKLERTSFLRMISGEEVMVARKNKVALKHLFTCHMACCGNKMIGYQDNKGELKRRIVAWLFDFKVLPSQADPNLDIKLEKEIPDILQKCVMAYLEYAQRYGDKSIWNVLPRYFVDASRRVAERSNPRRAFLESNDVIYGPDLYITEEEFRNHFMEFCKQRNFKRERFVLESWKSDFQDVSYEKNIKIDVELRGDRIYPRNGGLMKNRENFILGLDIKPDDFVVRNEDNE